MHTRLYPFAFLAALLILCASAFLLGKLVIPPGQADAGPGAQASPPSPTTLPSATEQAVAAVTETPTPRPSSTATRPRPTATRPAPSPTRSPSARPTATASPTVTVSLAPTRKLPDDGYPYGLLSPVRDTSGDCPGNYILGHVTDRAGHPLPGVTLRLVDEYGNQESQTTKSVGGDVGRYDFPVFGPPRRFFLSVVDAQGNQLSAVVQIDHGVGSEPQATCHWADWQQR